MLNYPEFDSEGKKVAAEIDGINKEMLMDIAVYRLKRGNTLEFTKKEEEAAVLLLEGAVSYEWLFETEQAQRKDVFSQPPYCLHVCREIRVKVTALTDCELIVQATKNERDFACHFYRPEECKIELMGEAQWEGTAKREVLTVFDYRNAPYSNMVMGEVITKAGRWSSYVPHSHDQPEVYYYKFDRPQGFGACFIGDNVYKAADGSVAAIPGGQTHPQASAPGYNMYYCWMIRHLPDNPWTARDIDPVHAWLLEE